MSELHGLLLVNKPSGITSHDVVAKARRLLKTRSVGHSGTLDPLASGLMVLLIGEGTKLSQYILERNKAYTVRAQFGIETDTLDTTGKVIKETPMTASLAQVREEALKLYGDFDLDVPLYSAVKVDGKKLYEYGRQEKEVTRPVKRMTFFDLEIVAQGNDWIDVALRCTKGSYIRSWVSMLGANLKVGAAMSSLVRTESQPYSLSQAIKLEDIPAELSPQMPGFIPMISTLPHYKMIRVKGQDLNLMNNGTISHDLRSQLISTFQPGIDEGIKIISHPQNELVALVGLEPEKGFVIRRVFRYNP